MDRINGAGHIGHLFVPEDVATNRPPTEITPEWMNHVQEEIAGFIEWAGLVLAAGDSTQLKQALLAKFATLASPALTGSPTAPTAAQFGNSTLLATTAFVQRAIGNLSGFISITPSATLSNTGAGALYQISNATPPGQTVTLPDISGLPHGATFWIINGSSTNSVTVAAQGGQAFLHGGTSLVLEPFEVAGFVAQQTSIWNVIGTLSAIHMQASLGVTGYQKLSSGLIVQWGQLANTNANTQLTVTLPIAFRVGGFTGVGNAQTSATGSAGAFNFNSFPNASQATFHNSSPFTAMGSYLVVGR